MTGFVVQGHKYWLNLMDIFIKIQNLIQKTVTVNCKKTVTLYCKVSLLHVIMHNYMQVTLSQTPILTLTI